MARACCSSGHAAGERAVRTGGDSSARTARGADGGSSSSGNGGGGGGNGGEQQQPLALVAAPLASIMASALPAVQGAVGAVQGAGDAVALLVATGLPHLLRRLQQQQQQQDDGGGKASSTTSAPTGSSGSGRRLATLAARDLTTFRALARAGEVGSGILSLGGVAAVAVASQMSPSGPGCCDRNGPERWANVLTSLPYVAVGLRAAHRRRTPEGRAWGLSMAGVGCASMFFHASTGRLRTWGRRLDYWAIAASSALLTRALRPGGGVPRRLTAASLLATPFRPFPVSTLNTLAMELEFLRRAAANGDPQGGQSPGLRGQQLLHSACAAGAMAFFCLEEALPRAPFLHSTWHLLSSVSCATTNALLEDVERDMGLVAPKGGEAAAAAAALAAAPLARGSAGASCGKAALAAAGGLGGGAGGRASLEMYVVPLEA